MFADIVLLLLLLLLLLALSLLVPNRSDKNDGGECILSLDSTFLLLGLVVVVVGLMVVLVLVLVLCSALWLLEFLLRCWARALSLKSGRLLTRFFSLCIFVKGGLLSVTSSKGSSSFFVYVVSSDSETGPLSSAISFKNVVLVLLFLTFLALL